MPLAEQGILEYLGPGIRETDGLPGTKRPGLAWDSSLLRPMFGIAGCRLGGRGGAPRTVRASWRRQVVSKHKFDLVTSLPRCLVAIIASFGLWWRPIRGDRPNPRLDSSLRVPSISHGADALYASSPRPKSLNRCHEDFTARRLPSPLSRIRPVLRECL
jgi:hypothetical protein